MKSTLKIDFQSRYTGGMPVVKIVQPLELNNARYDHSQDVDPKDTMLSHFLHTPSMVERNMWFKVSTFFNTPHESPTHSVTNIEPVQADDILPSFKNTLLSMYVPFRSLNTISFNRYSTLLDDWKQPAFCPKTGEEVPDKYDIYLKINEFFNWLQDTERASFQEQQSL